MIKDYTRYIVSGRGKFPIDMLRFDEAHPFDIEDGNKIAETFDDTRAFTWKIELVCRSRAGPVAARWESFNCRIVSSD